MINALGGVMTYDKFFEQEVELGYALETERNNDYSNKYVAFQPAGFEPLSPKGEYIIYASYNDSKERFYPTYYFYGIFNNADNTNDYKRYILDTDTIYDTITIDDVEKNLK